MNYRHFLAVSLVAIAVGAPPASAQQPAPATTVAIPKHSCVKPDVSRLGGTADMRGSAEALRMTTFNKEYKAYSECIKKYVEDTNAISTAANAAGRAAIDEFNAITAEAKAKSEASDAAQRPGPGVGTGM
jgi:hypothetical protein